MSGEMYELVALGMRYFFAAIIVLIVARAWKLSVVDSRRAKELRRLAPETGLCGEFLVVTGDGRRAREGMRYPVIREGLVGSSRKADVRVKSPSVRRAHAFFDRTDSGLRVRAQGRARMYDGAGALRREAVLGDGDRVTFGKVELMLVLTDGQAAPGRDPRANLFDVPPEPRRPREPFVEGGGFDADREPPARRQTRGEAPDASWDARGPAQDELFDADREPPARRRARGEAPDASWDTRGPARDELFDAKPHRARPASAEPDEVFDSWDEAASARRKRGDADGLFNVREDRDARIGMRGSRGSDDDPFEI